MEPPEIDYDAMESPSRQIAAWIRSRIESGDIAPGRKIPSETELVQAFGVARTTARRAVALLRDEGWVVTVAGRGSFAAERRPGG